jgi:LysR family cys regulon transcriptional activator
VPHEPQPELVLIPCHEIHRVVLAPRAHALAAKRKITLADICAYPIITYDYEFSARTSIMRSFHQSQLTPNVVLSATDADVMKAYVRTGLGIAVVAHTAYDRRTDGDLRAIDARHLFDTSSVVIGLRKGTYPTDQILDFIGLYAPHVRRSHVISAVATR